MEHRAVGTRCRRRTESAVRRSAEPIAHGNARRIIQRQRGAASVQPCRHQSTPTEAFAGFDDATAGRSRDAPRSCSACVPGVEGVHEDLDGAEEHTWNVWHEDVQVVHEEAAKGIARANAQASTCECLYGYSAHDWELSKARALLSCAVLRCSMLSCVAACCTIALSVVRTRTSPSTASRRAWPPRAPAA